MRRENVVTNAVESAPSANKIAQQVRRAERRDECVHLRARAEERGEHLFAHQPEHAARHHREADDPRRFGADSFPYRRRHGQERTAARDL